MGWSSALQRGNPPNPVSDRSQIREKSSELQKIAKSWTWTIWSLYLRGNQFLLVFSGIWLLQGVASTAVCRGCAKLVTEAPQHQNWLKTSYSHENGCYQGLCQGCYIGRSLTTSLSCTVMTTSYSIWVSTFSVAWGHTKPNFLVVSSKTKLYSSSWGHKTSFINGRVLSVLQQQVVASCKSAQIQ